MPKPAGTRGREIGIDLLDLGVSLIAVRAEFPADAALLVASRWGFVEGGVVLLIHVMPARRLRMNRRARAPSLVKTAPAKP